MRHTLKTLFTWLGVSIGTVVPLGLVGLLVGTFLKNIIPSLEPGTTAFVTFGPPALGLSIVILYASLAAVRRGRCTSSTSDDTMLAHELAQRAQDLSDRMEALEAILVDRARIAQ